MDKLRFLHIPKTAGSTFIYCLQWQYKGTQTFGFTGNIENDIKIFNTLDDAQQREIGLVWGHSPRITGISVVDMMPTVTFLRHPVRRVQSFCQHVSEGKSPNLLDSFPPAAFDLDQFLDSGIGELENMHARVLLGNRGYELPDLPPERIVDMAVEVLATGLSAFGIQEKYNTSLLMFKKIFGWKLWPVYQTQNRKNRFRLLSFSQAQILKIETLNQLDLIIYHRAYEIFMQRSRAFARYLYPRQLLFPLVLLRFNQLLNHHMKTRFGSKE